MTGEEFERLDIGDIVEGSTGRFVITECRPNGTRIGVQTRAIVDPSDWLCARGLDQVHVMSNEDREQLVAGDWLQLQGGHSYVVGMPLSKEREAATAVCVIEIWGSQPEDWDLVRRR